jgi:hypothetical protein
MTNHQNANNQNNSTKNNKNIKWTKITIKIITLTFMISYLKNSTQCFAYSAGRALLVTSKALLIAFVLP